MAHVLIVDDERSVRQVLRVALQLVGHEVTEAADGREALTAYRKRQPDLVICDLFMPEMDGVEVIRALRAIDPTVKVIAVSGGGVGFSASYALYVAGMLGASEVLGKPFSLQDVTSAVDRVLAQAPVG